MSSTPLPRSLDPLPEESLPGYLLRLAHRLGVTPLRLAIRCGLSTDRGRKAVAARVIVDLSPDLTADFARTTRLDPTEVTRLTLGSLADRYPFLHPGFNLTRSTQPRAAAISPRENWVFTQFTRYCPDCLAGDGSPIQQRHGGAWSNLWRLPIVFACPRHQRLLEHLCPDCGTPALHRRAGLARPLPMAGRPVSHPAACRNPARHQPSQPCGHRLDQLDNAQAIGGELLDLQQDLLRLLQDPGQPEARSLGQSTTGPRYLTDLRITAALLRANWPATRHLIADHHRAAFEHQLPQIPQLSTAGDGSVVMPLHDIPPPDAAGCAALLGASSRILSDPRIAEQLLRETFDVVPASREWIKAFLRGDGYCSSGMRDLAGPQAGAAHVIRRLHLPHKPAQPAPQPVIFGPQHVPQYLPADWYDEFFTGIHLDQHLVRRAVPILLVRACAGGSFRRAGPLIDLPRNAHRQAVNVITDQLASDTAAERRWNAAMESLINKLDQAENTDYGKRRTALRTWSLPDTQWRSLIRDLIDRPVDGRTPPHVDWGDQKRQLASVWIWTVVSQSEHHFAPVLFPDAPGRRPGGELSAYIHRRWPAISTAHGHYRYLRPRLDALAHGLATTIDHAAD